MLKLPERLVTTRQEIRVPRWLQEWYEQQAHLVLRREINQEKNRFPRIEIAAPSVRTGKTTALDTLKTAWEKSGIPVQTLYEEWWLNQFLTDSYQANDPAEHFFNSQLWFFQNKVRQTLEGQGLTAVTIQDVPLEMDIRYAMAGALTGQTNREFFLRYAEYAREAHLHDTLYRPDLLVYLTASDEEVEQRIVAHTRPHEQGKLPFFLLLAELMKTLKVELEQAHWPVLTVETDTLNFADNDSAKAELVRQVTAALSAQGWDLEQTKLPVYNET